MKEIYLTIFCIGISSTKFIQNPLSNFIDETCRLTAMTFSLCVYFIYFVHRTQQLYVGARLRLSFSGKKQG
jgi:hypothetical protein